MGNEFSYLLSIVAILVIVGWMTHARYHSFTNWAKHKRALLVVLLIGLLYSLTEISALKMDAWRYSSERVLGINLLGVPIETYLFTATVFVLVSLATWALADKLDKHRGDNN